jgi:hypothetical protein
MLLKRKFLSQQFVQMLQKEDIIMLYYQIAMQCVASQPKNSIACLKEIGMLCGFYEQKDSDTDALKAVLEALIANNDAIAQYKALSNTGVVSDDSVPTQESQDAVLQSV